MFSVLVVSHLGGCSSPPANIATVAKSRFARNLNVNEIWRPMTEIHCLVEVECQ